MSGVAHEDDVVYRHLCRVLADGIREVGATDDGLGCVGLCQAMVPRLENACS